ncbi:hypothetical protein SLE2022_088090 [Rubroshorea leprosula]
MERTPMSAPAAVTAPCWSNIVKSQPEKPQTEISTTPSSQIFVESCKSTKGISVAVVDANAVIKGGERLTSFADKWVTVPEVLAEIRDPVSRHRLAFIPFTIDSMEPSPEALNKVIKFARATGDLQTLSDVDLKLIALTYTLEAQIHGTNHLKDAPPPVEVVNTKKLLEKDPLGWGSNVPNLEEWEALEHLADGGSKSNSRILPLKDLNLNGIPSDDRSEAGSVEPIAEAHSENQEDVGHGFTRPRRYLPKKVEVKVEGKKMVADGIDASQGQSGDNADDWMPAVSRSTHRRYLRRKARHEYYEALAEKDSQQDTEIGMDEKNLEESNCSAQHLQQNSEGHFGTGISETEMTEGKDGDEDLSSALEQIKLEEDSLVANQEGEGGPHFNNATRGEDAFGKDAHLPVKGDNVDAVNGGIDCLEMASQTSEGVDASYTDDISSVQSWTLRSLSESTVACVTGDFAMQNVLLQMGLRLLAPDGMQIRQLQRWIWKCHACFTVTAESGRIFCPKCGNGGTLRKVSVTVGESGTVLAARRPRITLRGTKFSLPLPKGGRDGIAKNLILREDQLPSKFLKQKPKKKINKQGDDFFMADDIFTHHTDAKKPLQPPMRKALAVFSGKRNPNDNHYSRRRPK